MVLEPMETTSRTETAAKLAREECHESGLGRVLQQSTKDSSGQVHSTLPLLSPFDPPSSSPTALAISGPRTPHQCWYNCYISHILALVFGGYDDAAATQDGPGVVPPSLLILLEVLFVVRPSSASLPCHHQLSTTRTTNRLLEDDHEEDIFQPSDESQQD